MLANNCSQHLFYGTEAETMPPDQPSLKTRLAHALFGDIIQTAVAEATAAISVRVDDAPGWNRLAPAGPHDRDFAEWYQDQEDALEAWRKNFSWSAASSPWPAPTSSVPGGGVTISSDHAYLQSFVAAFAAHPKNRLAERYGPICDELTRAGEIFPVLFTNRVDGMSYLRFVPATQIHHIETDPDDYETELAYLGTSQHRSNLEPKTLARRRQPRTPGKSATDGTLPARHAPLRRQPAHRRHPRRGRPRPHPPLGAAVLQLARRPRPPQPRPHPPAPARDRSD